MWVVSRGIRREVRSHRIPRDRIALCFTFSLQTLETLENDSPSARSTGSWNSCFTCMGRDVQAITLLSTDAMGDSPWTIYLDGSKKTPSVTVEFGDKKLGPRFPFGKAALKKCP